jgi:hypothetical protein
VWAAAIHKGQRKDDERKKGRERVCIQIKQKCVRLDCANNKGSGHSCGRVREDNAAEHSVPRLKCPAGASNK